VSVGHLGRLIEEAGIPSVIIAVSAFRQRFQELRVARALITPYIMGRPLGSPGDNEEQRNILLAALDLLENAKAGGSILNYTALQ
jgi:hypothetical protein